MMKRFTISLCLLMPLMVQAAGDAVCQGENTGSVTNNAGIPSTTPTARFQAVDGRTGSYQAGGVDIPYVTEADFVGASVILDKHTGLMWAKCPLGYAADRNTGGCIQDGNSYAFTWSGALQAAADAVVTDENGVQYDDWRLPNIKELASLVERKCAYPALNVAVFTGDDGSGTSSDPGSFATHIWSNTPHHSVVSNKAAWAVDFAKGETKAMDTGLEVVSQLGVRLVRDVP